MNLAETCVRFTVLLHHVCEDGGAALLEGELEEEPGVDDLDEGARDEVQVRDDLPHRVVEDEVHVGLQHREAHVVLDLVVRLDRVPRPVPLRRPTVRSSIAVIVLYHLSGSIPL